MYLTSGRCITRATWTLRCSDESLRSLGCVKTHSFTVTIMLFDKWWDGSYTCFWLTPRQGVSQIDSKNQYVTAVSVLTLWWLCPSFIYRLCFHSHVTLIYSEQKLLNKWVTARKLPHFCRDSLLLSSVCVLQCCRVSTLNSDCRK